MFTSYATAGDKPTLMKRLIGMKSSVKILISVLLLLHLSYARGNNSFFFRRLDTSDGLPHNTVFCMSQDSCGFIWIGTRFGLCRYDGYEFVTYNAVNSPLLNHTVRDILPVNDSTLCLATEYGVYEMDIFSGNIRLLPISVEDEFPRSVCLSVSSSGNLLVASEDMGLFLYRDAKMSHIDPIPSCTAVASCSSDSFVCSPEYGLFRIDEEKGCIYEIMDRSCHPVSLYASPNGVLWVGTLGEGLYRVVKKGDEFNVCQVWTGERRNENIIKDVIEKNGQLFLASEGGLLIYDIAASEMHVVKYDPSDKYSLGDNALYSLLIDSEGGVWVGTYFRGISYISPLSRRFKSYFEIENSGASGQAISSFFDCGNGEIIISSEDNGFCYFNQTKNSFRPFLYDKALSYNNIHDVCLDADGVLWIGTYLHGIDLYNTVSGKFEKSINAGSSLLHSNSILRIFRDKDDNIHIGTTLGSSVYYSKTGVFQKNEITRSAVIRDIFQDFTGNIWYASMNKGLFRYNPGTGKWDVFSEKGGYIPTDKTVCVRDDAYGNIWIGTEGFGILKYNYEENSFEVIDGEDNLPDNFIFSLETSDSLLWAGTTKGLCRYNPYSSEWHLFTEDDGLPSHYFNYNASRRMNDGSLFFGTVNGFFSFIPDELPYNHYIAEAYVTSLKIEDKDHNVAFDSDDFRFLSDNRNSISFPYNQNNITLTFAGLSYSQPQKNRFKIWLQGYDKEYGNEIQSNSVRYSNLPSGTYKLHLKSSNDDGFWGRELTSLTIKIKRPIWDTVFAKICYLSLLVAILYFVVDFIKKKEKRKHMRQMEEKEKELNESRIAFFTNITHEIKTPLSLLHSPLEILKKEGALTESMAKNIAIMDRNLAWLDKLVEELLTFRQLEVNEYLLKPRTVDINDFLNNLTAYFEPYAEGSGIEFKFLSNVPSGFSVVMDPDAISKVVSNLITNAFKFTKNRVIVTLRQGLDNEHVRISVYDNGLGVDEKDISLIMKPFTQLDKSKRFKGVGIGLPFSKSLVELHGGSLAVSSSKGNYFAVLVTLPVHNADPAEVYSAPNSQMAAGANLDKDVTIPNIHLRQFGLSHQKNGHILIVEDNVELGDVVVNYLKETYCVGYSNNGKDALKYIELYHPDIVLSDVMMPGIDGIELCRCIKGDCRISHTSVVMLTAKTSDADRISGLGVGADAYLCKPFSLEEITLVINNLLNARQRIMDWALKGNVETSALDLSGQNLTQMDREFIVKVSEILTNNVGNAEFSADDLAKSLGMSKTLVYIKLKKLMNMSSTECMQVIRFNRAKELLDHTEKNISEIAYDLGFTDPNYFTRAFKRHFGMTPTQYRSENRMKNS